MFLSRFASRIRRLEAQRAKENRRDIARSLSQGQISKRDLMRWGLLSASGTIALKNGLSPFATSAYAQVPTGAVPTVIGNAVKFQTPLPKPWLPEKYKLQPVGLGSDPVTGGVGYNFRRGSGQSLQGVLPARRTSYHTLYDRDPAGPGPTNPYANPVTNVGPIEGRPPFHTTDSKDYFAHQRWDETAIAPQAGYILSVGQVKAGQSMNANWAPLEANSMWSFGDRYRLNAPPPEYSTGPNLGAQQGYYGVRTGNASPPLIQARYGEPLIVRIHNDLPVERARNGGFGRNEISIHNHNAHNAAESDGASNAYHFPGTFYDYHWSTILARHDAATNAQLRAKMDPKFRLGDARAATIDDNGNPVPIPGDFRELQSSLWFHDHRFFFTAENVQKGMYGLLNMYSAQDSGYEGRGLRLPSGTDKPWGNLDYDINLCITNPALDANGQLEFDITDTDGYLGDLLCVNGAWCPTLDVFARRYRFRTLNASMARFVQIALVDQDGRPLPFHMIANCGNLLPKPVPISSGILDQQGPAERYDIVVDFKKLKQAGVQRAYLVNLLYHLGGRRPEARVSIGQALAGLGIDPAVGSFMEFKIGGDPPQTDQSADFDIADWQPRGVKFLTEQIPMVAPTRERTFRFGKDGIDGLVRPGGPAGQCLPDCGEAEKFPWSIAVNGQPVSGFNAARISALVPAMGDVEHWTLINSGGGWDHPVHLHFEEGVTLNRGTDSMPLQERMARKDVWRLRPGGTVKMQLRFSEFGGAYVQHCHNTTHEDFAMIMRVQLLGYTNGEPQVAITPTPLPSMSGVTWNNNIDVLPQAQPGFIPATPPV